MENLVEKNQSKTELLEKVISFFQDETLGLEDKNLFFAKERDGSKSIIDKSVPSCFTSGLKPGEGFRDEKKKCGVFIGKKISPKPACWVVAYPRDGGLIKPINSEGNLLQQGFTKI